MKKFLEKPQYWVGSAPTPFNAVLRASAFLAPAAFALAAIFLNH